MNEGLLDPIRHNSWATLRLVRFCRESGLSEEQLATPGAGGFGGILETLHHVILADASYLHRLAGGAPGWIEREDRTDLEGLEVRAEEVGRLWERFLSGPIDAERVIDVDDGVYAVRAGILIAQALNHGSHHRQQVCAILRGLGIPPPDIQAWGYAWAAGRIWERPRG